MEEDVKTLADYAGALRRHKWMMAVIVASILAVSAAVALLLPPVYRSTATILIEQQEIPPELVRSTVTTFADQRIQVISQRVMTSANLEGIIEKYNLYAEELEREPLEVVIDDMRGDITVETINAEVRDPRSGRATEATIAFQVAYENQNPRLAQVVANELTTLFLNENVKSRTEQAEETTEFLTGEAAKLKTQVAELEREVAEFKERNARALPELEQVNLQLIDRNESSLAETDRQIASLNERRLLLQAELAQTSPYGPLRLESGERVLSPADKLKVLQTQYASLSAVYSEDHPDVMRTRREMRAMESTVGGPADYSELAASLDAAKADLAGARTRYSADHPDVKRLERTVAGLEEELASAAESPLQPASALLTPDNPVYIQLATQIKVVDTELAAARERQAELEEKVTELEGRLEATPQVEREYRAMMRDYENAVAKYQETKAKQLEAELAGSLEAARKGERFTLIEPPLEPQEPVRPNRLAIGFLGVVLSMAGGVGAVAVREALDSTVRGSSGVAQVTRMAPLAVIPRIESPGDRRRRWLRTLLVAGAIVLAIVVALIVFNAAVMPLDTAWFVALRRLGL